jgi:HD superfamily phosphohydrolase
LKSAKVDDKQVADVESKLSGRLKLSVCRDIVGNTICADLLDYLVRDWFHIGKAFDLDERIFQLMEVRKRDDAPEGDA